MIQDYFTTRSSKITYIPNECLGELRNIELDYDFDEEYFFIDGLEFNYDDDKIKIYEKEFPQLIKFLQAVYLDLQVKFPKNFPDSNLRSLDKK